MPVAEIAAAVTGMRAALDITKAMAGLRDAEAFRGKSIELQSVVLDAFEKAIEARAAHSAQAERIRMLEAEMAGLKAWDAEKQNYELKSIGPGSVACMLKPDKRGSEAPHWLCPNCYSKGQKAFLNPTDAQVGRGWIYKCTGCGAQPARTTCQAGLMRPTSRAASGLIRIREWPIRPVPIFGYCPVGQYHIWS
jgi:hypothetical protein